MHSQRNRPVSGHIYLKQRKKGAVWYWRVRLPDGTEERKAIGPAWSGSGRVPAGHFTEKKAEQALQGRLTDLRRGVGIPAKTGATFRDAAESWYHGRGQEADWKPSTRRDYRSALDRHLLPAFGEERLAAVTTEAIETWRNSAGLPRRTAVKLTAILHGIFERARRTYGLPSNPVADVPRLKLRYNPEEYDWYEVEEVAALVRAAESEQDGAIFRTAAFAGLRMGELLALRVRDVDFGAESLRVMGSLDQREGIGTTKSDKGRTVPMVSEVATVLAKLLQRERFTGPDDPVFVGTTGRYLDGSALRRRYKTARDAAKLRPIRFHDLRHTFGSLAVRQVGAFDVQAYMGHADGRTTARYTHYRSRSGEAKRLAEAFKIEQPETVEAVVEKEEA